MLLAVALGALALLVAQGSAAGGGPDDGRGPAAVADATCPIDPDGNCIWQCMDGVDNLDPEDTLADWPADPGCTSREDPDETNPPQPPPPPRQCADGQDNDGDARIDMDDPGCANPADDNESNDPPPAPPPPPPPPPPPTGDVTPPSAPGALRVTAVTMARIELAWNASVDNVAVAGYGLYRHGAGAGTSGTTAATFTGLVCGTAQVLEVDAFDAAGNRSPRARIETATASCPPFVDDTSVEREEVETTLSQAGYGPLYLASLTEPGGDRGTRSKEGCRAVDATETRKSVLQTVLYRLRLTVSWCWRSVWNSTQRRHVPEVYDLTSRCIQLDVSSAIAIDKSCAFPQTIYLAWNGGPRGRAETVAEGRYKNCIEGIPFFGGCFPWQWHHLITITTYGNGTWRRQ